MIVIPESPLNVGIAAGAGTCMCHEAHGGRFPPGLEAELEALALRKASRLSRTRLETGGRLCAGAWRCMSCAMPVTLPPRRVNAQGLPGSCTPPLPWRCACCNFSCTCVEQRKAEAGNMYTAGAQAQHQTSGQLQLRGMHLWYDLFLRGAKGRVLLLNRLLCSSRDACTLACTCTQLRSNLCGLGAQQTLRGQVNTCMVSISARSRCCDHIYPLRLIDLSAVPSSWRVLRCSPRLFEPA